MHIIVYGRKDCERCNKAKEKLALLKLSYEFIDIDEMDLMNPHKGWRDDKSVELLSFYHIQDDPIKLPMISIEGKLHTYIETWRALKSGVRKS